MIVIINTAGSIDLYNTIAITHIQMEMLDFSVTYHQPTTKVFFTSPSQRTETQEIKIGEVSLLLEASAYFAL